MSNFDTVLLYHAAGATYEDLTEEAASVAAADVYHSGSGCLLKDVGDVMYVGLDTRFRFLECLLSTAGVGGTVGFSYWDGTQWVAVTPISGGGGLDLTNNEILLWSDYLSLPSDWQKKMVNGVSRFWIRVAVTGAYSTGPVADHVSAVSETRTLSFRR
jgi:hypothetical protein